MNILPAALLAITLSLDSVTVGFLYGARRIRLTIQGLAVVGLTSGLVLAGAVWAGRSVAAMIGIGMARWGGALLLMAAGGCILLESLHQARRQQRGAFSPSQAPRKGPWRLFFQLLTEPERADLDASGSLSAVEALLLGLVLAVDSVPVGMGAGLAGFPPVVLAALTALAGCLFLLLGWRMGRVVPWRVGRRWGVLHGAVLVLIGLVRLL